MATTATPEAVEARIVEALASFGPDIEQVTRDATFEELDIDSLDLVELAQIVEDRLRRRAQGRRHEEPQDGRRRDRARGGARLMSLASTNLVGSDRS